MRFLLIILALCIAAGGANAMAPDTIVVMTGDSIQDAIDLADPGDTIEVRKGIYVENLVVETPGLTLKAKGATVDGAYEGPCFLVDAADVTIEGFRLINGMAGVYAHDVMSDIIGPADTPPYFPSTAHGLRVIDNEIYAAIPLGGILVRGEDVWIEGNTIVGAAGFGIFYELRDEGPESQGSRTFIMDNVVRHTKFAPIIEGDWDQPEYLPAGYGIAATGGRLDILGNHSEGNEFGGIAVEVWSEEIKGTEGPPFTRVIGNVTHYNGAEIGGMFIEEEQFLDPFYMNEDGIWIYDRFGFGTIVEKNITHKNGDDGIDLIGYGFVVRGNKASWNNDDGIEGEVGDSLFQKNVTWFNFDDGLVGRPYENDADGSPPTEGNRIMGNTSFNNSDEGIQFSGHDNYIYGNKANGNVQNGILVPWGEDVVIESNQADKNGHQGISNSGVMTDIMFNKAKRNGFGLGPDIAGQGDGFGTVGDWFGNQFDTGGQFSQDRCTDPMYDG
ncbi:MAG: right-handed parallel beta-helix repeat-containing protein [Planctomycetota bacterium]|jgi:hypothetical protein